MAIVPAALALLVSAALLLRFLALERAGRRVQVVVWLVGLLLVESLVWPDPNDFPPGVLHPDLGPTSFRLVDTVVLAAIVAGVLVRGLPARVSAAALWWTAFLGWLLLAAVRGVLEGHDPVEVLFQGKALLYLGVMCVVAGVPAEQWRSRVVDRALRCAGVLVAVVVVLDQAGLSESVDVPLSPLRRFGEVGADAATVACALGLLALLRALTVSSSRTSMLLAATAMLSAPLVAGQRAALLGLAVGLAVCLVLVVRGGQRVRLPAGDVVVATLALGVLVTVPVMVGAALGRDVAVPLTATVREAIDSRGKQLSAQGRVYQLSEARPLLLERPVLGWGLGRRYVYFEPGPREFITSGLTHNVATDLVLRTGLVGLVLFAGAVASTARAGLRGSRPSLDPALAGVAIAVVAVLAGWLSKGMVESLFEKYRLAVLLGLVIGAALALDPESRRADDEEGRELRALETRTAP